MSRYKLTLADEEGVVLEQWVLSTDPAAESCDYFVPLIKFGPGDLATEINAAIRRASNE